MNRKPPAAIRGVAAILGDEPGEAQEIALSLIDLPQNQPRKFFDPAKLEALKTSIKEHGILEPLLVRPTLSQGRYELVAGERRYRAAVDLKLLTVPVAIRELTDSEALEVALIENLQREDLNPIEETEAVLQILCLRLEATHEQVIAGFRLLENEHRGRVVASNVTGEDEMIVRSLSQRIPKFLELLGVEGWLSFATNKLPLLNLPEDVLNELRAGEIEYTKARAIARVKDPQNRAELLERAITEGWSLSQIREWIAAITPEKPKGGDIKSKAAETLKLVKSAKLEGKKLKQVESYLEKIRSLLEEP